MNICDLQTCDNYDIIIRYATLLNSEFGVISDISQVGIKYSNILS